MDNLFINKNADEFVGGRRLFRVDRVNVNSASYVNVCISV